MTRKKQRAAPSRRKSGTHRAAGKTKTAVSSPTPAKTTGPLPAHATSQALRQAQLVQMQQRAGNGSVNRKLIAETAVVQRYRDPRRPVPSLPDPVVVRAEDAIDAGTRQKAIDVILQELAAQGRMDISELDGGTMRYTASQSDEGHTISYWDRPPTDPAAIQLPYEVNIGPSAFASVPWLYATIIHEWRHMQQFRIPQAFANHNEAQEVDAYLNGIEQAWNSGLNTAEVQELWTRLHDDHWVAITDPTVQAHLQPRVNAARAYVNGLVASGAAPRIYHRLAFSQIFFGTGSAELDEAAHAELAYLMSIIQAHLSTNTGDDLRFTLVGFASPRWRHPERGAMPADLNLALSQNRAENTLEQIRNLFNADLAGDCDVTLQSCQGDEVTVDDPTWDSLSYGEGSDPAIAEGRALTSDDQQDRRVDIEVKYSPDPMRVTRPPSWLGGGGSGL